MEKSLVLEDTFMYELADFYKIFGDSTRLKIMYALLNEPKSVTELAESLGVTQSLVSHQMRLLRQNRLVKFIKDGKKVIYFLDDEHVESLLEQGFMHLSNQ